MCYDPNNLIESHQNGTRTNAFHCEYDLIAWFDSNKRLFLPNHVSGIESRTNRKLANTNIDKCWFAIDFWTYKPGPPYEIIFKNLIPTWSWKLSTFQNFSYQLGLGNWVLFKTFHTNMVLVLLHAFYFWLLFNKYVHIWYWNWYKNLSSMPCFILDSFQASTITKLVLLQVIST
jgi:hypothetical protein